MTKGLFLEPQRCASIQYLENLNGIFFSYVNNRTALMKHGWELKSLQWLGNRGYFKAHIQEKIIFSISRVWKGNNGEFPTSTVKVSFVFSYARPAIPKPWLTEPSSQCKLMAKVGALNIINWGKFSTSLPKVCARYSHLDNDTDMKKLKIKMQAFCTQKNKVFSSSPFTPLINYRLFP